MNLTDKGHTTKKLIDLDTGYKEKFNEFSGKEKLIYCNDIIDRFQKLIANNGRFLPPHIKAEYTALVTAAQEEVKGLSRDRIS